jgi:UDP-N-acetylglucosamine--N-acetylmuramyl-(pentapeptide) pyrophosphoryl-undecaprenol N-acetylglucosamine transferase
MRQGTRNIKHKKILLTGGGTGGSVSPLLAIAEGLSPHPPLLIRRGGGRAEQGRGEVDFLFVGTKNGPEREMVASASLSTGEREGIEFRAISAGKFRRYFSFKNLTDLFLMKLGFFQAFFIILKWKPDLIISAGSFVSVPVVWAGWILRVPILIHQQDVRAGLANKLMAPFAKIITVTFEESLKDYGKKAVWTGNPARQGLIQKNNKAKKQKNNQQTKAEDAPLLKGGRGVKNEKEENNLPVVLVIGGGTGAVAINELVWKSLDELTKFCNIIHVTGKEKAPLIKGDRGIIKDNYKSFEFLNREQIAEAYATADIVVSRAGMGVLSELSNLGKPAILIPMPDSHQEENAGIFKEKEAAVVLEQKKLTPEELIKNIKKLLDDEILRKKLSSNIEKVIKKGANEKIAERIKNLL